MSNFDKTSDITGATDLFMCLAEQLKIPFVQIKSMTDMAHDVEKKEINEISKINLKLIDGFLLSLRLSRQTQLELEPVPIGSLLFDVYQAVSGFADMNSCKLTVDVDRKCGLVMADYRVIKYALSNLVYSFVNSSSENTDIKLIAKPTANQLVMTGIFAKKTNINKTLFKKAKMIKGIAHQPMQNFVNDNAAGVFVADSLLEHIGSSLDVRRVDGYSGLATFIRPSNQLSLV